MSIRSLVIAAVFGVSLCAGSANAASMFVGYRGTIKFPPGGPSVAAGPCNVPEANAKLCPSGNCECLSGSGAYSGSAGKGTATFVETVDLGDGNVPNSGAGAGCSPATGVITVTGAKESETFIFSGGSCSNVNDTSFVSGGCVMSSSTKFSHGVVALCTLTGTAKGSAKVSIKGTGDK